MCACSSSSLTASLTLDPKIASGASSGVTIVIASSTFMSYARPAVINASSYSGNGHAMRPGETNATLST